LPKKLIGGKKTMKKILAILLALIMVFSLVACGSSDDGSSSDSSTTTNDTADNSDATTDGGDDAAYDESLTAAAGMGFYDADYDYTQNPKYKIAYMVVSSNFLYEAFSDSFQKWADLINVDYSGIVSANGDSDLFITTIETYATQGYDGLVVDPDTQVWGRTTEVCNDVGIQWIPAMSQPFDEDGNVSHPCVGFDNTQFGVDMATVVMDYMLNTDNYTGDMSKVGFIDVTFSSSEQLYERHTGTLNYITENYPEIIDAGHYFEADCVAGGATGMTSDGAYDQVAPIISANPDVEYWCVTTSFDDFAIGASRALDENGFGEGKANVTAVGGTSLILQWDQGMTSTWQTAIYTAQDMYSEPIICALYAFMSGQATPETIWPDWKNPEDGGVYAKLYLNSATLYHEDYQEYMEWVDAYTGMDNSSYDYNGTEYPNDHAGPY
jgi:ABC-type sugar transport system substrate-binding protein